VPGSPEEALKGPVRAIIGNKGVEQKRLLRKLLEGERASRGRITRFSEVRVGY